MADKAYSAGTLFLQVVPVFKDTMNEIRRKSKDLNEALADDAEKGGAEAGKRHADAYGKELEKGLGKKKIKVPVEIDERDLGNFEKRLQSTAKTMADALDKEASPAVARLVKQLEDISVGKLDAKQARGEIAKISRDLKTLANDAEIDFVIRADAGEAFKTARAFNEYGHKIDGQHWDVTLDLNTRQAVRDMGAFETQMRKTFEKSSKNIGDTMNHTLRRIRSQMQDIVIAPELDSASVIAEAKGLAGELSAIFRDQSIDIEARVDAASAYAELAPLLMTVGRLDGREIDIQADVDAAGAIAQLGALNGAMAATSANSAAMSGATQVGANSFRSFNVVLLAASLLLPALIPMIGALGGGLLALIPIFGAVGAGLGVMLVGFSGIPDAFKAMGDVEKNAAKESVAAGKTMAGAARSVADAERGLANARKAAGQSSADAARAVADAQRNSAKQIKAALDQQADAERNLAEAQRDSLRAQQDLRDARKKAEQELIDAADRRAQNALDERQGVIDVFNATVRNNAVQSDPGSTNLEREESDIALKQAQLNLKNIRDEQAALADEKKKYDREGIKGTDVYQQAQDKVIQALERQRDAERAVGEAAQAVRDARVNGARAVADAVRSQQRSQAAGAQQVADAERGLQRAQEDYQTALVQTQEIGSASMQKLEDAMGKLGPAGQHFARFLFSLRAGFHGLRADIQESMLPGVESGLRAIIGTYGPQFRTFATDMAGVMGNLFRQAGQGLGAKPWQDFFSTYAKLAPRLLGEFGQTTGNWMTVYARLFTIVAPFAERLSLALLDISERAARWMESSEGTKFWTDFMEYASRVGPMVADFFISLWNALVNIGRALAPLGELTLKVMTGFFKMIAAIPAKWLGFIIGSILAMVIAFQLVVGGIALWIAGGIIMATTAGLVVFAILAVVGALVAAYLNFESFRKIVDSVAHAVAEAMVWLWESVLLPVFTALWTTLKWLWEFVFRPVLLGIAALFYGTFLAMKWAWDNILKPVFIAIWTILKWLWEKAVRPYLGFMLALWTGIFKAMVWVWKNILWPVLDLIATVIWKLLKVTFGPVLKLIGFLWGKMADGMKWAWQNVLKPMFDVFTDKVLPHLQKAFAVAVGAIKTIWEGLKAIIAAPIRFVIETVLNGGLIKAFNWVAGKVGSKKMGLIPVPDFAEKKSKAPTGLGHALGSRTALATGGVMPGYTPGRDPHKFYSATGGELRLSGGEAVMRPEFTRVAGKGWVDHWNHVAMTEGVAGIRKRMEQQAFRSGGIMSFASGGSIGAVPRPKAKKKVVWPVPGHDIGTYAGHDGVDINRGSGSDDYGDPIWAFRDGRITYVGSGRGYGTAVFQRGAGYPEVVYGHMSRATARAGQSVSAGQVIGYVGSTGNSSAPHLHFGVPGGTYSQALSLLGGADMSGGAAGGGGIHIPGWVSDLVSAPAEWLGKKISGPIDALKEKFGNNNLVDAAVGTAKKLLSPVGAKLKDMAEGFKNKLVSAASAVGNFIGGIIPGGSDDVKDAVRDVAAKYGWDKGAQWDAIDFIVSHESGWDPNADNPSSSAAGLFQKMTSIHGDIESTVAGQAKWGMGYIRDRYGDPLAARRYWESHGNYAQGGVLPGGPAGAGGSVPDNGTMMYDSGGYLPPGMTTVLNLTGKPEPVFTSEQFATLGRDGGDGESFTYAPTFEGSKLTPRDVAEDFEFTYRHVKRRGGRYAGSRS